MGEKPLKNFVILNAFIWLLGFVSLCLIEIGLWLTTGFSPLYNILLFTLIIYSLIGIAAGLLFGLLALFFQQLFHLGNKQDRLIHFSMALCIFVILMLYESSLIKIRTYLGYSALISSSALLLATSLLSSIVLYFFFRWMDKRGKLIIAYISILPAFWIFTSLKFIVAQELLPPLLQIVTSLQILFLLLACLICFVSLYFLFSMMFRFLKRDRDVALGKPAVAGITIVLLMLIAGVLLVTKKDGNRPEERAEKNDFVKKPNVVLITMDTVRADHLSCYGYRRQTSPNVDNLSREGVIFKNTYATTSWTLPSHASIFTGLYPSRHGADHKSDTPQDIDSMDKNVNYWNKLVLSNFTKLSNAHHTLAEILKDEGYKTAGIIGGIFCTSIFGLEQGFDYYDDEIPSFNIKFFVVYQATDLFFSLDDIFAQRGYLGKRIAVHLNDSACTWLEKNSEHPFFLFINYMDAHTPYLPPPPYERYFANIPKEIITSRNPKFDASYITAERVFMDSVMNNNHPVTPEGMELIVSQYDGGIRYLDYCLGLLFDKLKALNVYDNTLIIVTSDHGEAFGEHHQMEHGRTLYEEGLRVPLIIKYPAVNKQPGVVEHRVSLVDLMPTILAQLHYPVPSEIDGKPIEEATNNILAELKLTAFETRTKNPRDLKAIYQGKDKYIWSSNGAHELYDITKDPREEENLIVKLPHIAEAMQAALQRWLASFTPPNIRADKVKIDSATLEKLRALGYVN